MMSALIRLNAAVVESLIKAGYDFAQDKTIDRGAIARFVGAAPPAPALRGRLLEWAGALK